MQSATLYRDGLSPHSYTGRTVLRSYGRSLAEHSYGLEYARSSAFDYSFPQADKIFPIRYVMADRRALRHAARMRGDVIDESEIIASMDLARLLAIPTLFVICFIVIEFRLMQVVLTSPRIGQTGSSDIFYQLLVLAAVITAVAALIYFLLRAPVMLVHGLLWIARGNHERRIGIIGLAVLCVGFLLQAWVNILP